MLIFGKTISGTEASMGRSRLPKPLTVAGMTKKKIINMAWARWSDLLAEDYDYPDMCCLRTTRIRLLCFMMSRARESGS